MKTRIVGTGSYVPEKVVTNLELETLVETNDEWIRERTGIASRHIAIEEGTTDLAYKAAERALENAGMEGEQIDLIIAASITSNSVVPSLSCMVQAHIGAEHAVCFDINAACSGFVYALHIADSMLQTGLYKTALILGSETLSKITNWEDRGTCILFGDGAGAAVLKADEKYGILNQDLGAIGKKGMVVYCHGQSTRNHWMQKPLEENYLVMNGGEVFKFAVSTVPSSVKKVITDAGVDPEQIRYYILHQANYRIIEAVAKRMKCDLSKLPVSMDRYGNTSSASVPIMLDEVNRSGGLKEGDYLVLSGFGGGLTWASVLLQW